jgi:hypothetical protein
MNDGATFLQILAVFIGIGIMLISIAIGMHIPEILEFFKKKKDERARDYIQ